MVLELTESLSLSQHVRRKGPIKSQTQHIQILLCDYYENPKCKIGVNESIHESIINVVGAICTLFCKYEWNLHATCAITQEASTGGLVGNLRADRVQIV